MAAGGATQDSSGSGSGDNTQNNSQTNNTAMADVTITTSKESLRVLFNQMKHVFYLATKNTLPSAIATFDKELPVLKDGVTFDTGSPDITKVKLTTGDVWTAVADAGDPDITFQVASVAEDINALFLNVQQGTSEQKIAVGASATVNGKTYKGYGYDMSPKKATGGLFLTSEDGESAIFLPNVEMYANLVSEEGKPAYFNVSVSPLTDTKGASIYIFGAAA